MSQNLPPPSSPSSLQTGIRGRVEGVTRIGPRAIGLGVLLVVALLGGILYGLNRPHKPSAQQVAASIVPIAPPQPSTAPHFGENVAIVESPPPEAPPPAVLLPPSPPPALETPAPAREPVAVVRTVARAEAPSAAAAQAAARHDETLLHRRDEERAQADALKRAYEAPIFTGTGGASAGGGSAAEERRGAAPAEAGDAGRSVPSSPTPSSSGIAPAADRSYLAGPFGEVPAAPSDAGTQKNVLKAGRYAPSTLFELVAGAVIPAALVTGIDSELPGLVTGQVREDVYDSKSGRYLLVPKGSRLIGIYKNDVAFGKSRVLVAWQRLIFPDTSSIDLLNMSGADVQGGGGLGGKVDNHTGQLIGATLLSSILAAGVGLSQPRTQAVVSTTAGSVAIPSAGQAAAQGVGTQLETTAQGLIAKNLNIPPVVHVAKGYPFIVIVDRDMLFPGPYVRGS